MKLKKRRGNGRRKLTVLCLLASLVAVVSCAKSQGVKFGRPNYELPDPDTMEASVEAVQVCEEVYGEEDEEILALCESQYDMFGLYWDSVGIIAEYESVDIWDDELNFDERPANHLLRR